MSIQCRLCHWVTETSASAKEVWLLLVQRRESSCWLIWRKSLSFSNMDSYWGFNNMQHKSWHFHVHSVHMAFIYSETIHFLIITRNNKKSSQRPNDRELGTLKQTDTICISCIPNWIQFWNTSYFFHNPTLQVYINSCFYTTFLFLTTWHCCTTEIKR